MFLRMTVLCVVIVFVALAVHQYPSWSQGGADTGARGPQYEFEVDVGNGPYSVVATVAGGSSPTESYAVHVDMGPGMVTWSGQNLSHIYGQPFPTPVQKRIIRWERVDTFIDADMNGLDDDDSGDFRDEDYDPLVQKGVDGITIDLVAQREDRRDEADHGLTPMELSGTTMTTDASGIGSVNVTNMGDVGGVKQVVGRVDSIFIEWFFDTGVKMTDHTFDDENDFGESTNLIAIPVVITLDLADNESGIDFATVVASLNGTAFFDAAAPPAVLPVFPELLQVVVGGVALGGLDASIIANSAFKTIQITYLPDATKMLGANTVELQLMKDNAENEQDTMETLMFPYP